MPTHSLSPVTSHTASPNLVTDPERVAEIVTKAQQRLAEVGRYYQLGKQVALANQQRFNADLRRLRAWGRRYERGVTMSPEEKGHRLHTAMELEINRCVRDITRLPDDEPMGAEEGARIPEVGLELARRVKPIRGRPDNAHLKRCVRALMAIYFDATGVEIIGQRTKGSEYGPHLEHSGGKFLRGFFDTHEPSVTDTMIVNMVRSIRREQAGRPLRYINEIPQVRLCPDTGKPAFTAGNRAVERSFLVMPIYCP